MRKKIPFLAFALFAVSCGGGVSENSQSISTQGETPEGVKVAEVCKIVKENTDADVNIVFSKEVKGERVIPKGGILKITTEEGTYTYTFCGFGVANSHGNCFVLDTEGGQNYCDNIKGIVLYQNGLKAGEIKDIPFEVFCSNEKLSKAQFSGITVENFLHKECSEETNGLLNPTKTGNLKLSVKLPKQLWRNIPEDTDLIRIDIASYSDIYSPGEEYVLDPIILSKENSTVNIKVPAGYLRIFVSLWDNDTDNGTTYPIAGGVVYTSVKEGENKTLTVYVPTGIWNLNTTINGIEKIQVGEWPSQPQIYWGDTIPTYVVFDKEQLEDIKNWNADYNIWNFAESIFLKTENKTLYGFINPRWNIKNLINGTESYNLEEFSIYAWDNYEGTIPDILIGKFENGTQVTLYSYEEANCTVTFHYENGTNDTFSVTFQPDCLFYLPLSVLSGSGDISGNYTYDNLTVYANTDGHYLVPVEECLYADMNCAKVTRIDINYSFKNVTTAEATISDLPLPWRDEARIEEFNASCSDDGLECTYYWNISNPKSHGITCYLADGAGNIKKEVNCTTGNYTCTSNSCPWELQDTSFVVRDEAFVQPLADVAYLEPDKITYYTVNREFLNDTAGVNPRLNDVADILRNTTNGIITIIKGSPITCEVQQGSNDTVFVFSNCTDSSLEGEYEVTADSTGLKVYIKTPDNQTLPVAFAYKDFDRDAIVVYQNDQTIAIAQHLANSIYNDAEFNSIVNGTWKVFRYFEKYSAWIRLNNECITFDNNNNTYTIYPENATGNYTISNGTLQLKGYINDNETIVQYFFDPELLILSNGNETIILERDGNNECP